MRESDIRLFFRNQAAVCSDLESPFTARLCELFAERLNGGGPVGERVLNWQGGASGRDDALALRLCGALHSLVIEKLSNALAAVYPPNHDQFDDDSLWRVIEDAFAIHSEFILERLESAPQTNEVRRASILLPGFWQIARASGLPLVLSELGTSAGLNLHWDQFFYQLGDISWGDKKSRVQLQAEWRGPKPEPHPIVVNGRAGCDLNPLDPAIAANRNRLMSYIWPDQYERIARTRAAIDIAASAGTKIEKSDAIDWLQLRLSQKRDNAVHVVYHTIAWQYFPKQSQQQGVALLEFFGALASIDAPLAWLRFEMDGNKPGAALKLTLWPSGEERCLARADFHGRWINWVGKPSL